LWALSGGGGGGDSGGGDDTEASVVADAIARPEAYVLKPQREGGGNNLYGDALKARLARGGPGLGAYILMQRILPPPQRSVLVRRGAFAEEDALSELGIYGVYVRVGQTVKVNADAGHLVRTKAASSDEGGVAAGFAVLDSPLLADPGEGLLPAELEGGSGSGSGGGGVLGAVRRILLQGGGGA
jgi:glutathione synthase